MAPLDDLVDPVQRVGNKLTLRIHSNSDFCSELGPMVKSTREFSRLLWGPNAGCQSLHIEFLEELQGGSDPLHLSGHQTCELVDLIKHILLCERPESVAVEGAGLNIFGCTSFPLPVLESILAFGEQLQRLTLHNLQIDCSQETTYCSGLFKLEHCSLINCTIQLPREQEKTEADPLVSHILKNCVSLKSFSLLSKYRTIYEDGTCWSSNEATVDRIFESNATTISLFSPWMNDEVVLRALKGPCQSSNLQELHMSISNLDLSTAKSLAKFLNGPSSLTGLYLEVQQLGKERTACVEQEELLEICSLLADALRANQKLRFFQIRPKLLLCSSLFGRWSQNFNEVSSLNQCHKIFASMLQRQYILEDVTFLQDFKDADHEDFANMELFLKLNRHGRQYLLNNDQHASNEKWLDQLTCFNDNQDEDDLDCVFTLLQMNPTLCTGSHSCSKESSTFKEVSDHGCDN